MDSSTRQLLRFLGRYKWRYFAGVLFLLVCDIGQLFIPFLLGRFADDMVGGLLDRAGIIRYALLLVGLAAVIAVLRFWWRIFVFGTARQVEFDLREQMFDKWQTLSSNYYHRNKVGDLMAHATNDLQAIRAAGGEGILMAADSTFMGIATLIIMLATTDWRLTVLGLLPLPLLAVVTSRLSRVIHVRFRDVQAAFSKLSDRVQENISGMRVVKGFVQEEAEEALFDVDNKGYYQTFRHMVKVQAAIDPLIGLLAGLSFVIVLGFGGNLVLKGDISLGTFIAANSYLGMLVWPMMALGWVINLVQRATASWSRIQVIFDEEPEVADGPATRAQGPLQGRIEFKDLTFKYGPDLPPALTGIQLTIEPGQTLGVLGRTGSGKSTLTNLLVRQYNPPAGQLLIDGVDINEWPLAELRSQIGYVPQDSFLFSRTILGNIGFAPEQRSEDELMAAAAVAQVHEAILEFPAGYQTVLGERGVTLSGGQRQRVSIARAIAKNPPLLVLDDCLSAVDTNTEALILQGLRPIMAGRTTVLVSHRVSAVKEADQIIVLDQGEVVEHGTHDELLALGGEYYRLYQIQQLEESIASEGGVANGVRS